MKPVINSHLDYRRFLNGIGGMYRINWRSKPPAIREIYLLEAGNHHSTKFWYVRLYLIMMVIHMTSWDLPE